jgi:hypothetical protein
LKLVSKAGTQPKTPSMILVTRMSDVLFWSAILRRSRKSQNHLPVLLPIIIGVDLPEGGRSLGDRLDYTFEVLDASLQQVGSMVSGDASAATSSHSRCDWKKLKQ